MRHRLLACAVCAVVPLGAAGTALAGEPTPQEVSVDQIPEPDLEIYMDVRATPEQIERVRDAILAADDINEFAFLTKRDALREFKKIFKDDKELINSIQASSLPVSFRLRVGGDIELEHFAATFEPLDGVDEVGFPVVEAERAAMSREEACDDFEKLKSTALQNAGKIEVFLVVDATDVEIDAVRSKIDSIEGIRRVRYLDKEAALDEFRRIFEDSPDLVEGVDPETLPASFRITLEEAADAKRLKRLLERQPGVDDVATPLEAFGRLTEAEAALEILCAA